jgi:protein-tyrosine-phosphatase
MDGRVDRVIRAVLTHPASMAVKTLVKDTWWRARGGAFRNPGLPREVRSILFVCQGNICRSPFAAARTAELLAAAGASHVRCLSAGIRATQAARPPHEACAAADAFGLSLRAHEPLQLTRELVCGVDMTVVVEAGQMAALRQEYPEAHARIFLLPLFDSMERPGYRRFNIADPFGQAPEVFDDCYQRVDRAVRGLVAAISAVVINSQPPTSNSQIA